MSKAYAKVNLSLDVTGINKNGYHLLDMVNCTISLHDTIKIKYDKHKNDIIITSQNKQIPLDETNSVYKVILKFKNSFNISCGIYVSIDKKIPLGAGLGGGSSDASCVLKELNKHFNTKMTPFDMIRFIASISSDSPYLIYGHLARVKGIGEQVSPIKKHFPYKLFIVKPKSSCLTKDIFSSYSLKNSKHINTNKIIHSIKEEDFALLKKHLDNVLTDTAISLNNDIKDCLNDLKMCGFEIVSMSGSGSTCFGISTSSLPYKKAKKLFNKDKYDLCKTYKVN